MEYLTFTRDIHSLYSKNITIVEVLKTNIYVGDEGPFLAFFRTPPILWSGLFVTAVLK